MFFLFAFSGNGDALLTLFHGDYKNKPVKQHIYVKELLQTLWQDEKTKDVLLLCGGKRSKFFTCHASILALLSDTLKDALVSAKTRSYENLTIHLPDYNANVVEQFLHLCYMIPCIGKDHWKEIVNLCHLLGIQLDTNSGKVNLKKYSDTVKR